MRLTPSPKEGKAEAELVTPMSIAPMIEYAPQGGSCSVGSTVEGSGKGDARPEVSVQRSLAICVFNVFCGIAMVVTNKKVLELFNASNAWLAFQDIMTVGVVLLMQHFKLIDGRLGRPTPALVKIAILYTLNVGSSLFALGHLTVPMYSVLKRITILIVFAAEYFMLQKTDVLQCGMCRKGFGGQSLLFVWFHVLAPSIALIVGSTVLAGAFDLDFTMLGYGFAMLSCLTQGFSYILSKKYHDSDKQHSCAEEKGKTKILENAKKPKSAGTGSVWDVVLHTSLLGPLILLPVVALDGEVEVVRSADWSTLWYNPWLIANTAIVIAFQFSQWLNCNVNSPLTLAVTNQVKAAFLSLLGLLFFRRATSYQTIAGIVLNIAGGCWYAHTKYKMHNANTKAQKSDTAV